MKTIDPELRYSEDLTKQQVYDFAVYHLGTMPERCVSGAGTCLYRSRDEKNNSCAVGYFLKDEEIPLGHNGTGVSDLFRDGMLPVRLAPHINLLTALQAFHDRSENWIMNRAGLRVMLQDRGRYHSLDISMLDHPDMAWNKKESRI